MAAKSRMACGAIGLVVALAVAVYAFTDDALVADVCYLGGLVGASIIAWVGAARAPRGRRLVPLLVATGVSLTALGDLVAVAVSDHQMSALAGRPVPGER